MTHREHVVITGIAPVTPVAGSLDELAAVARATRQAPELASGRDWFDAERFLGARGHKYFSPATRYLLAASARALEAARAGDAPYAPSEKGVFVGTNFAAYRTLCEMDDVVMSEGADGLQPMTAPNFSVNIPASQVSIKHELEAFNVTLTSAIVAGLEAVAFGARAIRAGRARLVLAGATEDAPPLRVADAIGVRAVLGGACAFVLESETAARDRGAPILARVRGAEMRFVGEGAGAEDAVARFVDTALDGVLPRAIAVPYAATRTNPALSAAVDRRIAAALARRNVELIPCEIPGGAGQLAAVSPLVSLAALAATRGHGVVAAMSPQGHLMLLGLEKGDAS